MKDTIPIGVRVQRHLLERAKKVNPDFNLSEFVRGALLKEYGNIEDKVDSFLKELDRG